MKFKIQIKASARKTLRKLPASDRKKILERIVSLGTIPRPPKAVKLTNQDAYRVRQGDYRILYTIADQLLCIEVIRIGHRRDVYK